MTKRIIISLAQENQAAEENKITGAAIDQTKGYKSRCVLPKFPVTKGTEEPSRTTTQVLAALSLSRVTRTEQVVSRIQHNLCRGTRRNGFDRGG